MAEEVHMELQVLSEILRLESDLLASLDDKRGNPAERRASLLKFDGWGHQDMARCTFLHCFWEAMKPENLRKRSAIVEYVGHSGGVGTKLAIERLMAAGLKVVHTSRHEPDPGDDYLSPRSGRYHHRIELSW